MNKIELTKTLTEAKLLFGFARIAEAEVAAWFNYFGSANAFDFRSAMMAAAKSSKFFPTPAEVQKFLDARTLPPSLLMTPEEALLHSDSEKNLLIRDARKFANLTVLQNPRDQYQDAAELDRANSIHRATWAREFKGRFARKQAEALSHTKTGMHPKLAIIEALKTTCDKSLLGAIMSAAKVQIGSSDQPALEFTGPNL